MYILLPGRKILISPEWLRVFSWNFGNIHKMFVLNIFLAQNLKYEVSLHEKFQFLHTTHTLLTKFHMEKIGPFLLFNFTTWYKL